MQALFVLASYTLLVEYIGKNLDGLMKNQSQLHSVLATLSYSDHSIGVLAVL